MSSRREFDDWYWWETNYNWHCSIIILLETNPNISTLGETQSSSLVGGGELIYWTASTESLINIHQWESNNISLYRWRERGCSWTNVRPELTTRDLTSSISYGWCMMFGDCVWCRPCIAVWQMYVAVWRRETPLISVLTFPVWLPAGWDWWWNEERRMYLACDCDCTNSGQQAAGRFWEKPVISAWLCDDVCCDTGLARTLYKHRTAGGALIIKYQKY